MILSPHMVAHNCLPFHSQGSDTPFQALILPNSSPSLQRHQTHVVYRYRRGQNTQAHETEQNKAEVSLLLHHPLGKDGRICTGQSLAGCVFFHCPLCSLILTVFLDPGAAEGHHRLDTTSLCGSHPSWEQLHNLSD